MANSLYQTVIDKLRRIPTGGIARTIQRRILPKFGGTGTNNVPFAMGRVYKCIYRNWHHDPKPLLFILSSDAYYTHGINIHYLSGLQTTLLRIMVNMKNSKRIFNGMIIYQYFKRFAPGIPKMAYRVYFTKYLFGKLVSDGISNTPSPILAKTFANEPFVFALNKAIRPKVINRTTITPSDITNEQSRIDDATTLADQVIIRRNLGE